MIALLLATVTATFHPAAPTVGDPIVLEFRESVTLDESVEYELVQQKGRVAVVRTFRPQAFMVSGETDGVRFQNLRIPVQSVLRRNDDLKPAPLTPPVAIPYPRAPFLAIAIAVFAALVAWASVWWLARKRREVVVPAIPAEERFRRAVLALRASPSHPRRWAALADATRAYLAVTRPHLGAELTTSEVVPRLQEREGVVREILGQGDREKFSPWGAEPGDFDDVAQRALELVPSVSEGSGREEAA